MRHFFFNLNPKLNKNFLLHSVNGICCCCRRRRRCGCGCRVANRFNVDKASEGEIGDNAFL